MGHYAGERRAASYLAALLNHVFLIEQGHEDVESDPIKKQIGSSSQGYGLTPIERKAVEDRVMDAATEYYQINGWKVTPKGRPFDLHCRNAERPDLFVEVKASTGLVTEVIITRNEAEFAKNKYPQIDLFLLQCVKLVRGKASGGIPKVAKWKFDPTRATVTHYRYRLD